VLAGPGARGGGIIIARSRRPPAGRPHSPLPGTAPSCWSPAPPAACCAR
jgi:hypothetical protein